MYSPKNSLALFSLFLITGSQSAIADGNMFTGALRGTHNPAKVQDHRALQQWVEDPAVTHGECTDCDDSPLVNDPEGRALQQWVEDPAVTHGECDDCDDSPLVNDPEGRTLQQWVEDPAVTHGECDDCDDSPLTNDPEGRALEWQPPFWCGVIDLGCEEPRESPIECDGMGRCKLKGFDRKLANDPEGRALEWQPPFWCGVINLGCEETHESPIKCDGMGRCKLKGFDRKLAIPIDHPPMEGPIWQH